MIHAAAFIPLDRRLALAVGRDLPSAAQGSVLFADISGFTPLTNAMIAALGPRRGVDATTHQLNRVYTDLVAALHDYGGSVIGFSGDGMTCWFQQADDDPAPATLRATGCALAMQAAMAPHRHIQIADQVWVELGMKTAIATGPVQRYVVGDPTIQRLDVLAGRTLDRVELVEKACRPGETLLDASSAGPVHHLLQPGSWRGGPVGPRSYLTVAGLTRQGQALLAAHPAPLTRIAAATTPLTNEQARPWLLPAVYSRLQTDQGRFLAELRPAAALFLRFGGLDFDGDPEAGGKLDAFVCWVQQTIARYAGALIQLTTGDKGSYLYMTFGTPVAHDDYANRAVAAALDLLQPPAHLPFRPQVQIGVNQGRMRTGAYGGALRCTYGAQGSEVNMAARLMMAAQPGQILLGPRTAAATRAAFTVDALGEIMVKGREEPLPVYTVTGRRQQLDPQHTLFHAPLVGRDKELADLADRLAVAQSGRGQVVLLEGEAGVGKSRLTAAFLDMATEQDLVIATAACQSTSQETAYFAVRQLAWRLFGLDRLGDASPAARIDQVEAMLTAMNPKWLVRMPLLGDLLGLPMADNAVTAAFDPRLRREALLSLAVEVVQSLARRRPLLLVLEDVHWLDEASRALTLAVARALVDAPVLLLLVSRPLADGGAEGTVVSGGQESGSAGALVAELAALPYLRRLVLRELSGQGIAALVTRRLQGPVSPLALDLIQTQAQGNPFYTEELVDALQETGALVQQSGVWTPSATLLQSLGEANCLVRRPHPEQATAGSDAWRLAPDASLAAVNLGIPDSIHGIVLTRLDRLPESLKVTLKVASVIGRVFDGALLQRAHPLAGGLDELEQQLAQLASREFARLETPEPTPTYIFKHNITQEVVYRTLLDSQRHELHLQVGQALEELAPDAVEQLAFHFSNGDLGRPPVRTKTLHYLDAAGRRARRDYANETALAYFDRALALEERREWLQAKVDVLHILGRRMDESVTLMRLSAQGEEENWADVPLLWSRYHAAVSNYEQAVEMARAALQSCREHDERSGIVRALIQLAEIAGRRGDYEQEAAFYAQALPLVQGDERFRAEEATIRYGLGIVARQQGSYEAAVAEFDRALQINRALGRREHEARALSALGYVAGLQSRFADAGDYHADALRIRRTIGDRAGEGASLLSLAQAQLMASGDYSQSQSLLQEALSIQQAVNDRWRQAIIWNELGILYMMVGMYDLAGEHLGQALALAQEIGAEAAQGYILCNLGQVQRESDARSIALETLTQALATAEQRGDEHLTAICHTDLAITLQLQGDFGRAIEHAEQALAQFQAMGLPLSTTADLATLAACHAALGQMDAARRRAHEALALLDQCGGVGPDFPHRDYWVCWQALELVAPDEQHDHLLESARRLLMAKAGQITDPAMRTSFLDNVPFNRALRAAATEHAVPGK